MQKIKDKIFNFCVDEDVFDCLSLGLMIVMVMTIVYELFMNCL